MRKILPSNRWTSLFLIRLISAAWFLAQPCFASEFRDSDMSPAAIAKRLEPIGKVNVFGQQGVPLSVIKKQTHRNGKEIYQTICSDCHATGEVRSPRFGSKTAWKPRYKQGLSVLYEHAINGFNFMPPKGTCDDCTDEEIEAAVRYMVKAALPFGQGHFYFGLTTQIQQFSF